MVKASDFDSDMHRFESYSSCQVLRPRSSVVEHRLDKARVGGSFPPGGTKFLLTAAAVGYIIEIFHSSTAVVQETVNLLVVGSIPACGAKFEVRSHNGIGADC